MIRIFAKALAYRFQLLVLQIFNAFVISIELGFTKGYIIFFTDLFVWGPFSRSLKAWHFSPKLFTLSFRLTEDMLLPERCWKKAKEQTSEQSLSMQLLTFECLNWAVWFIRKSHSNVRDSGCETAQKWLKGPRKLFDIVKVWDSGVRDTKQIYKGS